MPELPEVETVKRTLQKTLISQKIKAVSVYTDKMVQVGAHKISSIKLGSKKISANFSKALASKRILSVDRRAKYLIIKLSGDSDKKVQNYFLMIHLRMSGQLIYVKKADIAKPLRLSLARTAVEQLLPTKHSHIQFDFQNGDKLFYNDTRQFGHIRLATDRELQEVLAQANLGPEPLDLSLADFREVVRNHSEKRAKDFLLNQNIIAGIGNIYADEALFAAAILPIRKMKTLQDDEVKLLHSGIKRILSAAIKDGGSSIEYFLATNGAAGKFSEQHMVYAKAKKPCPNCGEPLVSRKIGSRTTTFCERCQR